MAKYDDSKHYTDIQAMSEGERQSFARNYEISLPQVVKTVKKEALLQRRVELFVVRCAYHPNAATLH
ncbi:hypothetical protein PPS11_02673 [Pseudomonas putida S11]|nr:hypothetical protein PPS11_02673 [Pseudomonas putida S11]